LGIDAGGHARGVPLREIVKRICNPLESDLKNRFTSGHAAGVPLHSKSRKAIFQIA